MRRSSAFAVLAVLLVGAAVCPAEQPVVEAKPGIPVAVVEVVEGFPFQFKVQYWRSDGTAMFRDIGFDPQIGPWESRVEFPMDGNFIVFGAEYAFRALGSRISLDLNYGFSEDIEGTTKDWDWVWGDPEPLVYAESDTDGDSDFLTANVYYRLFGWGRRNSLDAFVGYQGQKNSFSNDNARVLTPEFASYAGKVAEYEMEFSGVRAGLRTEIALAPRFSIRANLAAIPYVELDANGKWFLRDIFFTQSADGYGVDFDLSLDFEVARNINLVAGLKYLFLNASDGEESGVAGGMPYGPFDVVDEVESEQFGATGGVLVKF